MNNLNTTVSADRPHIGFFGLRNAGKSSVVNAVTGQNLSLVSDVKGTTTDPVQKAMELLPLGPVVIIDTPGMDDEGELGEMRVHRARQVLARTDIAVLVVDAVRGLQPQDEALLKLFQERKVPYLIALNKCDLLRELPSAGEHQLYVSAQRGDHIHELKEAIAAVVRQPKNERVIVGDLLQPEDIVVLVTPVDSAAPKGRLILPQQQTIRDVLDHHALNVVVQVPQLKTALAALSRKPRLVITDSQAFGPVSRDVPEDIPLTSFSILFARYKGQLEQMRAGRGGAGSPAGWRYGADLRGLHPPPPVRGYRHGKAACAGSTATPAKKTCNSVSLPAANFRRTLTASRWPCTAAAVCSTTGRCSPGWSGPWLPGCPSPITAWPSPRCTASCAARCRPSRSCWSC